MNIAFYSYLGATLSYVMFALLLLFSWHSSLPGKLLFISALTSSLWALFSLLLTLHLDSFLLFYQSSEILRYVAWYMFLLKLFENIRPGNELQVTGYRRFAKRTQFQCLTFAALLLVNEVVAYFYTIEGQYTISNIGGMVLSLIGLAITEQLYRNTARRHFWAIKFLLISVVVLFAYDFYMYADALLFGTIDQNIWTTRGMVHIIVLPMLVIASARNKDWSLNIFVSRDIILGSSVAVVGGLYLLLLTVTGYYVREVGGDWGELVQITLTIVAIVLLIVVISSASLRARARVFLGKHFYKNKYDYRLEWLRLTDELKSTDDYTECYEITIRSIAQIVDAHAGQLWLRDENGSFHNLHSWHNKKLEDTIEPDSSIISFLVEKKFVINLLEIKSNQKEYENLSLPQMIDQIDRPWLVVPLFYDEELLGFIILTDPLVVRRINWEDRDLLKTAAKQIASYIKVMKASAQLAENKQFEVFSRLSAFMVHDLKNVAAELELVAQNSKKFAGNPEFVTDAFETIENTSEDIKRILSQLRHRYTLDEKRTLINMTSLLQEVVDERKVLLPIPFLRSDSEHVKVSTNKLRMSNVLAHLIENAQQATDDAGEILVTLSATDEMCTVEIKDNGHGMSNEFVRDRLFKPFETTKGNAGMGIGMYESREFMRQMGGEIIVESEPGIGTKIILNIPLRLSGTVVSDADSIV